MPANDLDTRLTEFEKLKDGFIKLVKDYAEKNPVEYDKSLSLAPKKYLSDISGDGNMIVNIIRQTSDSKVSPMVKQMLGKQLNERMLRFEKDVNSYKKEVGGEASGSICDPLLKDLNELKRMIGITASSSAEFSAPSMKK
jgi:hypothetical protein